uniref:Uncharacterized protein n=1 Tax=Manihot esculenta TaxID=3983 RepID=A0A2C9VZD1_MANES
MMDPIGFSGGLALFWKESSIASLISYSTHHIDVLVTIEGMTQFRLIGFYGYARERCVLRDGSCISGKIW